ncbi:hypothetical protein ASG87_10330 [Frateuria sp. Soil773]|nr:hypothetical protein ASG87_10330 [Frateuria sp. Soil773]
MPAIPKKDAAQVLREAPEPWRSYLIKARAAERIADPLRRCLAFPDLPGNHWPEGHAAAHCAYHALQRVPTMSLDTLEGYLQRKDIKGLRAKMDGYLDRHFAKEGQGEDIHMMFGAFDESDRSDRLSQRWLMSAPDDPYANLARADYLLEKAWKVRGKEYVAKTPEGNMENMHSLVDRAMPLFDKASKLEPRLMPAYIGMMSAAMLIGRSDLIEAAFASAQKQDPACLLLVRQRLQILLPRWGGSYARSAAYMAELAPHLKEHPGLATYFSVPYLDQASYFEGDDFYKAPAAALVDHAVDVGSYDDALQQAGDIALNRVDAPSDEWRSLALLLQEARFRYGNAWADRMIAWDLVQSEPEWALHYLARAQKLEPANAQLQYLLGAAYHNTHRFALAQQHYEAAIKDPKQRHRSLRELSTMWLFDAGLDGKTGAIKAKPFVDRLLAEYPKDGRGWIYHFDCLGRLGQSIPMEELKQFLAVADRSDPRQIKTIAGIESALEKAGQASK